MHLKSLTTYQYRNLSDQTVLFAPGINLIFGKNGQGKTNLIEAVHFLSTGKSFRTGRATELVRIGDKAGSVFGLVSSDVGEYTIGLALEDGEKQPFYNGNEVKNIGDFFGKLICISFTPTDIDLVKGGPQERRRFIDKHAVDLRPGILSHHMQYSRALRNKNALLKSNEVSVHDLGPWNQIMAEEGARITAERLQFLSELQDMARSYHQLFSEEDGEISLELKTTLPIDENDGPLRDLLFDKLSRSAEREVLFKSSLVGPHRDDIAISFSGKDARSFASQGQTRSIVLSLKLAVIELIERGTKESPVVLLDDVDAELDKGRSEAFFEMLFRGERQVIITATDARVEALRSRNNYEKKHVISGVVTTHQDAISAPVTP